MEIKNVNDSIVFNEKTFTKRVLYATEDVLCFVLNMKRGHVLPVHKHENTSLVMIVLAGSGQIQINEETEKLTKGSVVYAKGEDDFSIPSVSEDMTLYVTISPNPTNKLYSQELG